MSGQIVQLSIILVIAVSLGLVAGVVVDILTDSRPLFTLVLSLVGISLGSALGVRLVLRSMARISELAPTGPVSPSDQVAPIEKDVSSATAPGPPRPLPPD